MVADRKHRFIQGSVIYMAVFRSKNMVNFFGMQYNLGIIYQKQRFYSKRVSNYV